MPLVGRETEEGTCHAGWHWRQLAAARRPRWLQQSPSEPGGSKRRTQQSYSPAILAPEHRKAVVSPGIATVIFGSVLWRQEQFNNKWQKVQYITPLSLAYASRSCRWSPPRCLCATAMGWARHHRPCLIVCSMSAKGHWNATSSPPRMLNTPIAVVRHPSA